MGAGVVVSRFFGSREVEKMRAAIHTNIAFGLAAGVFLTVVGMLFTPQILQWMGTPEDVMPQSVAYIRTYFAGSIGLVMYNQCRGVMQAVGDSRHPLYYLIISSVTNVVLDILLIAVFKMDVDENPNTARNFGIMSIPTLLFKKDGQVVKQVAGVHTAEQIKAIVAELS